VRVVRLDLAYDGTDFRGWARQPRHRTVEGVLEDALETVIQERPRLSVAGRTDAGVHARGQVASFSASLDVDVDRIQRAVNGMLAPEVVVVRASNVPQGFDARRSATAREYRYRISTAPVPDPFTARFAWHRPRELSVPAMRRAARDLVGEHDFASFCRAPQNGPTIRRLERLAISRRGDALEIVARANGFLHQMVRSLVGTIVAVGEGRIDPGTMRAVLSARDRRAAGSLAPPHGLTLERVVFATRGSMRLSGRSRAEPSQGHGGASAPHNVRSASSRTPFT
jgi:tRNA pseudouridine38-40 synthase